MHTLRTAAWLNAVLREMPCDILAVKHVDLNVDLPQLFTKLLLNKLFVQ